LLGSTLLAAQSNSAAAVRLPLVQAIGFAGHGVVGDESRTRASICKLLTDRKAATQGIVYGITSIAAHAALLFAESCLELEIPLRVLLPAPPEIFRKDLAPSAWPRIEKVLAQAMSVAVAGNHELRDEGYYECDVETVQHSQLLIALYDDQSSPEADNTREIVELAREIGRPVISIHSGTGAVEVIDNQAGQVLDDSELQFLNDLPDAGATLAEHSPIDQARAWFQKIDANASRFAPQVRRMASIPILFTAIAALFSGAAARNPDAPAWLGASAAMGIFAAALPAVLRLRQRQVLWIRTRTAAEVCRSVLALWAAPGLYEVIGAEVISEFSGMLRSLNFLKMVHGSAASASLNEFKAQYRHDRLSNQIDYFSVQSKRSQRDGRNLKWLALFGVGFAVFTVLWWLGAKAVLGTGHPIPGGRWLPLFISALFQIATISGALVVVYDCDRRQRRYGDLRARLQSWEAEFAALRTWASVLKVVNRVERALLVEMLEWRSLAGNTRLPRK
jgi:hypothetical protein